MKLLHIAHICVALATTAPAMAQERDVSGWTYGVCGMKLNVFTGKTDSSLPTVAACVAVTAAQIKVIKSKPGRAHIAACSNYSTSLINLEYAKARTGLLWFHNFICTQDCSGHESGSHWAEENEIESTSDCPHDHGKSFEEGCWSYRQEIERAQFYSDNCQLQIKN
jgi:hypothetical protein